MLRLTKKTRAALAHLRRYDAQQEGLTEYDRQFERLLEAGLAKRTQNRHLERFYSLTPEGDDLACRIANEP